MARAAANGASTSSDNAVPAFHAICGGGADEMHANNESAHALQVFRNSSSIKIPAEMKLHAAGPPIEPVTCTRPKIIKTEKLDEIRCDGGATFADKISRRFCNLIGANMIEGDRKCPAKQIY